MSQGCGVDVGQQKLNAPPEFDPNALKFRLSKKQRAFLISGCVASAFIPVLAWLFVCFLTPSKQNLRPYYYYANTVSVLWAFVLLTLAGFYLLSKIVEVQDPSPIVGQ